MWILLALLLCGAHAAAWVFVGVALCMGEGGWAIPLILSTPFTLGGMVECVLRDIRGCNGQAPGS